MEAQLEGGYDQDWITMSRVSEFCRSLQKLSEPPSAIAALIAKGGSSYEVVLLIEDNFLARMARMNDLYTNIVDIKRYSRPWSFKPRRINLMDEVNESMRCIAEIAEELEVDSIKEKVEFLVNIVIEEQKGL